MVDPYDGHIPGIIDWEFVATPTEAMEQYPVFIDRINAIMEFECLLSDFNNRPIKEIMKAVRLLQTANVLHGPLPRFP
jgi:hypothetical protein